MKQGWFIILLALTWWSIGCNQPNIPPSPDEELSIDSISPLSFDTTRAQQILTLYETPYSVTIESYSLNDSSVFEYHWNNGKQTLIKSHNYEVKLTISEGEQIIYSSVFDKAYFSEFIDPDILKEYRLEWIRLDGFRTHRIFFEAQLKNPANRIECTIPMGVYYIGTKQGNVELGPSITCAEPRIK